LSNTCLTYPYLEVLNHLRTLKGLTCILSRLKLVATFDSSSSWKWGLDYLETGLELLGFKDVAALVKTDFPKSASVFAEGLKGNSL